MKANNFINITEKIIAPLAVEYATKNMNKISISIPIYINNEDHLYFTKQTINSINTKYNYLLVIVENFVNENFREELDSFYKELEKNNIELIITENPYGNNVSGGWNTGINLSFQKGIDIVIIPNNDVVFHPDCIDNLVEFTKNDKYILWTALEYHSLRTLKSANLSDSNDNHPGFSLFAVTKEGLNKLAEKEEGTNEPHPGRFDPGFAPAYFEDLDMACRILNNGFEAGKTAMAQYYHYGSRTIKTDDELNTANYHSYEKCRNYFKEKWGIDAHGKALSNEELKNKTYMKAFNR